MSVVTILSLLCLLLLNVFIVEAQLFPGMLGPKEARDVLPSQRIPDQPVQPARPNVPALPNLAPISSSENVPGQYKSWSLFLVCNPTWLTNNNKQLRGLYDMYSGFGRAIGEHHAAVWFWTKVPGNIDQENNLEKLVDVNRSQKFCGKLSLDPARSPHVVVTTKYPDLIMDIQPDVVLGFGGKSQEDIRNLLLSLTRQVTQSRLDASKLQAESTWQLWVESISHAFCRFPQIFKSIDFKVGKLEFREPSSTFCSSLTNS